MLEREYKYFETIASQLAIDHPHKFAVIKEEQVLGIYDTMEQALEETARVHKLGTFIVQLCEDRSNIVQRFHSRVAFA
ncbi:MAG: hypothetical protein WCH07_08665 [Deltaproteobacteria bacterium]|jgi:hypothetical protein